MQLFLLWLKQAQSNNVPINGPLLLEKAMSLVSALGHESFIPSTGFIDRWIRRHGISMKIVSSEKGSMKEEDVSPWSDVTFA